jgi:hypothetical protein
MGLPNRRLELAEALPLPSANPDRFALLGAVISADSAIVGRERFALRSSAYGGHVVPVAYRNSDGVWSVTNSLLDAPITMPADELTVLSYLERFCLALTQASGKPVALATVPHRLLASRRISMPATNQPASQVLIAVLQSLDSPLTWRLLFSPTVGRGYFLNVVPPG